MLRGFALGTPDSLGGVPSSPLKDEKSSASTPVHTGWIPETCISNPKRKFGSLHLQVVKAQTCPFCRSFFHEDILKVAGIRKEQRPGKNDRSLNKFTFGHQRSLASRNRAPEQRYPDPYLVCHLILTTLSIQISSQIILTTLKGLLKGALTSLEPNHARWLDKQSTSETT